MIMVRSNPGGLPCGRLVLSICGTSNCLLLSECASCDSVADRSSQGELYAARSLDPSPEIAVFLLLNRCFGRCPTLSAPRQPQTVVAVHTRPETLCPLLARRRSGGRRLRRSRRGRPSDGERADRALAASLARSGSLTGSRR